MYQDQAPAPAPATVPAPPAAAPTSPGVEATQTHLTARGGSPQALPRTASPPPGLGSQDAHISRRYSAMEPSSPRIEHDLRGSPPRRRGSTFTDRGPYDHDAHASMFTTGLGAGAPLPPIPQDMASDIKKPETAATASQRPSGLDWIVPEKPFREKSIGDRLNPTLLTAIAEKEKYAKKAHLMGWTLNIAIGLQVLLGALTTGLSAAATSQRQSSISTTILGGLSTLVASYMARARGSNEPALSLSRVKDLDQFIRECEAFQMDYGHLVTHEFDNRIDGYRHRFEELLGNANQERRLSTPV